VTLALARVDDRLVHGQVLLAWAPLLHAVRLLVADDGVAASPWERDLAAASSGDLEVHVMAVADCPSHVRAEAGRRDEAGAPITQLAVGGLHYAAGKDRVLDFVYLDEADRHALRGLVTRGVRVYAQDVPASRPLEARAWLESGPPA
jgi:mannose/fructose/N-acetylgalactosamine-specific phosphotransferase system component IIB